MLFKCGLIVFGTMMEYVRSYFAECLCISLAPIAFLVGVMHVTFAIFSARLDAWVSSLNVFMIKTSLKVLNAFDILILVVFELILYLFSHCMRHAPVDMHGHTGGVGMIAGLMGSFAPL